VRHDAEPLRKPCIIRHPLAPRSPAHKLQINTGMVNYEKLFTPVRPNAWRAMKRMAAVAAAAYLHG
jgi:hypothetical protein